MPSFGTVYLPTIDTSLLDLAKIDQDVNKTEEGRIKNVAGQQELKDREELRGLAAGLAAGDPAALARAAVLGQQGVYAADVITRRETAAAAQAVAADKARRETTTWVPAGGPPAGVPEAPPGDFQGQVEGEESGGVPSKVNLGGFSGLHQFGAARLADRALALYQPAPGEDLKANEWRGQFSIPGHPNVRTHADFLANPDAQRAAFALHVGDIDQSIAATPGADGMDRNGLRAVAHLGGIGGMRQFVASRGQYDPADANGTKLSHYYQRFAEGGAELLAREFGPPGGAPRPGAGTAPAPGPAPVPLAGPAPVRLASAGRHAVTMNDASPTLDDMYGGGMLPPSVLAQATPPPGAPARAPGAPSAVVAGPSGAPPPTGGVPGGGFALPPTDGRPPVAPAAAGGPPGGGAVLPPGGAARPPAPAALPPGAQFAQRDGQYLTTGLPPGYAVGRVPDGRGGWIARALPIPGVEPEVEIRVINDQIHRWDKRTGKLLSKETVAPKAAEAAAVPFGWKVENDGSMSFVPGGPADPKVIAADAKAKADARQQGHPLPAGDRTVLVNSGAKLSEIQRLSNTFDENYAGFGVSAYGDFRNALARNTPGESPRADWWQGYQSLKNQVRNEMFGAALTAAEKAEFEKADINPGMSADTVRKNLERQGAIVRTALERRARSLARDGYRLDAIEEATGLRLDPQATPGAPTGAVPPPGDPAPPPAAAPPGARPGAPPGAPPGSPPSGPPAGPPAAAVQHLQANPGLAGAFDAKYGPGSAARVLGQSPAPAAVPAPPPAPPPMPRPVPVVPTRPRAGDLRLPA